MKLYAESSAVLSWLFREASAVLLKEILERAELVVASELTLVECDRALIRAEAMGQLSQFEMGQRRALLEAVSAQWILLKLGGEIVQRARRRFPQEPIRALDSLHLASALTVRSTMSDLALLSLDQRVRDNGIALGFDVLPG
jgi:predicted nucleic acid-binding protein